MVALRTRSLRPLQFLHFLLKHRPAHPLRPPAVGAAPATGRTHVTHSLQASGGCLLRTPIWSSLRDLHQPEGGWLALLTHPHANATAYLIVSSRSSNWRCALSSFRRVSAAANGGSGAQRGISSVAAGIAPSQTIRSITGSCTGRCATSIRRNGEPSLSGAGGVSGKKGKTHSRTTAEKNKEGRHSGVVGSHTLRGPPSVRRPHQGTCRQGGS